MCFGEIKVTVGESFRYLDDLIRSGNKNIVLDTNIVLNPEEELKYKKGIDVDVDDIVIDGKNHIIYAGNKTRIFNVTAKNVTIKNFLLREGFSQDGGAIKISNADVLIENVMFLRCNAKNNGAGIHIRKGKLNLMECSFLKNKSRRGAALYSDDSLVSIEKSRFRYNIGFTNGGAIRKNAGELKISNCLFSHNKSRYAGAVFSYMGKLQLEKSAFHNNIVVLDGGAIRSYRGDSDISECNFLSNRASLGGALSVISGRNRVALSEFRDNVAIDSGGAIGCDSCLEITGCDLSYNRALGLGRGGAIYNIDRIRIRDSIFSHNTACFGGAVYDSNLFRSRLKISDCELSFNRAHDIAGAIFGLIGTEPEIENCTFNANLSKDD